MYYARVWIQGYYFDAHYTPTADLSARVAVVTGGTVGGLGFAAAELLAQMGATTIVTCRSEAKGKAAVAALKQSAGHDRVSYVLCDFMSCASCNTAAREILTRDFAGLPQRDQWILGRLEESVNAKLNALALDA